MADQTAIEWCDSTFNPWTGCTKVSPACDHCYAEAWSKRAGDKVGKWGPGAPRVRTTWANWRKPVQWNAKRFMQCRACGWRGEAAAPVIGCGKCGSIELDDTRRRVFCSSLADVFDNEVDPEWRRDLLRLIASTQDLDWLLLTKRIGNASRMLADAVATFGMTWGDHWRNVWLGATICNQLEADRDIPKLLTTPARVRFLSIEPMLGPINLGIAEPCDHARRSCEDIGCWRALSWVIVGGESGPHARPMHPDWVRSLRNQCAAAGVPFLFKQWGDWEISSVANGHYDCDMSRNGAIWLDEDGTITSPSSTGLKNAYAMIRVGKKAAGRLLDGRTHDGFPEVSHG